MPRSVFSEAAVNKAPGSLLADIREQGHEASAFDCHFDRALKRRAIAAALTAEELALASAHLLQTLHVLIIDKRRPRTAFLGAEPTAVFPTPPELLADHCYSRPQNVSTWPNEETIKI